MRTGAGGIRQYSGLPHGWTGPRGGPGVARDACRAPLPLILGPPEHQKREHEGPRDLRQVKSAFQGAILPVFDRKFM